MSIDYPTTFIVIHEEHNDREFPDSDAFTITRIDGPLADKVRAHYGKEGDVTIHQRGQEGGYSEYTVEWDWEVDLRVGDEVVFEPSSMWNDEHDFTRKGLVPSHGRPTALAQHLLDIRDAKAGPVSTPPPLPEQPMHVLATGPDVEDVPCDHEHTVAKPRLCDRAPRMRCTDCGRTVDPDAPTVADLAGVPIWRYAPEPECEHGATYTGPAVVTLAGTFYGHGLYGNATALSEPFTVTYCLVCHRLARTSEEQP